MDQKVIIALIVFILAFVNVIRALKFYNLLQIMDNKPKVNALKFFDTLNPFAYALFMLYVYPIRKNKYPKHIKEVNKINFLVYITYVFIAFFIIANLWKSSN